MDAPRIVVINHDPAFLNMMSEILTEEGYEATCWHADEDSFARLQSVQPALVILDIAVHSRDAAWTLLETIHQEPTTATIPVIVCTADIVYVRSKAARLLQYKYAVVEKPFNLDDMLRKITEMIASSDLRAATINAPMQSNVLTG